MSLHLIAIPYTEPSIPRENAGTSVAGNNLTTEVEENDAYLPHSKDKGGFTALTSEEPVVEDEDEDFGGLMVCRLLSALFIILLNSRSVRY
jgi:hypothetical protein